MHNEPHHYDVQVKGDYPFRLRNLPEYEVLNGEVLTIPIRVSIDRKQFKAEKAPLQVVVRAKDDEKIHATEETNFMGPGKKVR